MTKTAITRQDILSGNFKEGAKYHVGGSLDLEGTQIKRVVRENLGEYDRNGHAFKIGQKVHFTLGCHFGDYEETLEKVVKKYGEDSDYANSIREMNKEAIKIMKEA